VIVYGRNPVREALRGPREVRRLWATPGAQREAWLRQAAVPTVSASADELEQISGASAHQGVCAEVSPFRYAPAEAILASGRPLVALDQVQDPQNLGAIARTAECAGAGGLIIPERRAAEVTAAVCKASAGAVEHLPIANVRNLADFLGQAKAAGYWCYGADREGAVEYRAADLAGPVVLVLGSEGKGLRPRVAASCDAVLSIPVRGKVDSLSVSAAAAVLIYAASGGQR
jgi:23S rRNA (guanosine2251-2'-O)-methyltransferase